eukprot:scaffold6934_cov121-Isochrysis_galbana.AAC.2
MHWRQRQHATPGLWANNITNKWRCEWRVGRCALCHEPRALGGGWLMLAAGTAAAGCRLPAAWAIVIAKCIIRCLCVCACVLCAEC